MPLEITFDCKTCQKAQSVTISNPMAEQVVCPQCGAALCRLRNVAGYLYILSNPQMPGLLKIGLTARTVAARVAELNSATGVPMPFRVEAVFESSDPSTDEAAIQKRLERHRVPKPGVLQNRPPGRGRGSALSHRPGAVCALSSRLFP